MIIQIFWGSDNIGKYQKYIDLNKDKLKDNWKLLTHSEILKLLNNEYNFLDDPLFRRQNITFQADLVRLLVMEKLGGCYIDLDVELFVDTVQLEEEVNRIYDKDIFLWDTLFFFKVQQNSQSLKYLLNYYIERKYNLQFDFKMLTPKILSALIKLNSKIIKIKEINFLLQHLEEHRQ
jgi:mannosyltransferase OCH1-like enzyme